MARLRKFRSLARREKGFLCEASILFLAAKISVHTVPFRHIDRYLRARWEGEAVDARDRTEDIKLVRGSLARAASLFSWEAPCLSRSIAEFIMLRRRGIPAVLYAGVKVAEDSSLAAHAWVEAGSAGVDSASAVFAPVLGIGQGSLKARSAPQRSD